jgi:KaiC/GvpD/RAD55 family RecA-like ATPase
MIVRALLPKWAQEKYPDRPPVMEGVFEEDDLYTLNTELYYNIHYLPNYPKNYNPEVSVEGSQVDTFNYVFVDMDLKDGVHTKESFINLLKTYGMEPTRIIDSGNGIHAYWAVSDLDPLSYLRLQRRLCRLFDTDETMAKIFQLMRPPGFVNTKHREGFKPVELIDETNAVYTCEQLNALLPPITLKDEEYCQRHMISTYDPKSASKAIQDLPKKWFQAAKKGTELYNLFYGNVKDRSKADYRIGHLLAAEGFDRDEIMAVLANTAKALERSPHHRYNYANNIVEQLELAIEYSKPEKLGYSVDELLADSDDDDFEGTPFRCHPYFDATVCGFRLTHVLGLVGGAGSGKTAVSLNYFYHFAKKNPEYVHVVFSLEQPMKEIAKRWRKMAGTNKVLNKTIIIVDNYNKDGTYRNLSLDDCEAYVRGLQEAGTKVGCVMIDHIGILKKETKNGEREELTAICQRMKSFAVNRNVLLIMQSQTNRDKAKGGDVELDKDAAYGTTTFEWYVDWLVTIWQPLKRVYEEAPHMTITCFKYCKIRHKSAMDELVEDKVYALKFDQSTGLLRRLTIEEKQSYDLYAKRATAERNRDKVEETTPVNDPSYMPKEGESTDERKVTYN